SPIFFQKEPGSFGNQHGKFWQSGNHRYSDRAHRTIGLLQATELPFGANGQDGGHQAFAGGASPCPRPLVKVFGDRPRLPQRELASVSTSRDVNSVNSWANLLRTCSWRQHYTPPANLMLVFAYRL